LGERRGSELIFSGIDSRSGQLAEVGRVKVDPSRFINWALSPDGTRIAWTNFESRVHILTLRGGAVQALELQGWATLESIAWSLDGVGLYLDGTFSSLRLSDDVKCILRLDLDGTVHVLLKRPNQWFFMPTPSPDGRYLAFGEIIHESNAWMVEGF
jgi:hypothetical protein